MTKCYNDKTFHFISTLCSNFPEIETFSHHKGSIIENSEPLPGSEVTLI